jgi:hypothetical protein
VLQASPVRRARLVLLVLQDRQVRLVLQAFRV